MAANLLTVVVPFFNVENYFRECLHSLRIQLLDDIEIILVDDGSSDASVEIAEEFVAIDPRFQLINQPNRGLGPARNAGLALASGDYLAFVDSDDIVPAHAYDILVSTLETTGADIACGNAERFNSAGNWQSSLHVGLFTRPRSRTHISRHQLLINDRTVWNKVYRRSFWIRNNFRFPSHLYEDAPVTVPAHVLASAVDVVTETVYYWRKREGLDLSITQRLTEEANLRGRMCQITSVSEFLRDACPALKPVYERAALEHDVAIMLSALPSIEISLRTELCERLHRFAVRAAPTTARMLSPITKSSFDLLLQRRFDELVEAGRHVKGTEFL